MTADLDLTVTAPGHALRDRLLALDFRIFEAVAARHWPGADPLLPKLSRRSNTDRPAPANQPSPTPRHRESPAPHA
ncbi:phosphoesterase, partial [Streptomyces umbrinus]